MRLELEHVLSEKFAVSAILFLQQKKIIYKFDLRAVTKSTRQIDRLVRVLSSARLIYVDDISNRNRREYRISLTDEGRVIAQNLDMIEEKRGVAGRLFEISREMLIEIHLSGAQSLADLSRVRYFDEGRKLLTELNEEGLVEIERYPSGAPNLFSPVPFKITAKGEVVAKKLLEVKKAIEE